MILRIDTLVIWINLAGCNDLISVFTTPEVMTQMLMFRYKPLHTCALVSVSKTRYAFFLIAVACRDLLTTGANYYEPL